MSVARIEEMLTTVGLDIEDPDPIQVARDIVVQILTADRDPFDLQDVIHARDRVGVPLRIFGVRWQRSKFEGDESAPVYALLDVSNHETGERELVSCGGRNVLAQLVRAVKDNMLPADVYLEGRDTAQGFTTLWLRRLATEKS